MKFIKVKGDKVAIVDAEDFETLNQYKWHLLNFPSKGIFYVIRSVCKNGKSTKIYMHRQIMNCPKDMQVDHINNNTLDNRRTNLRICTGLENRKNRKRQGNSASKYIGVRAQGKRFAARIWRSNKTIVLGTFDTEVEAAKAYDRAALMYRGEFAHLNFPLPAYPPGSQEK